jgi:hypothetical protein
MRPVHLNGSLGLTGIEDEMRMASSLLGSRLIRFPGNRCAPGEDAEYVTFGALGYADEAAASYTVFNRLRDEGVIADTARFQVCMPGPVSLATEFVRKQDRSTVQPALEAALLRELDQIIAAIPARDLALQWTVTVEFFTLETGGWSAYLRDEFDTVVRDLARLGDAVPKEVELGYHFSYGNLDLQYLLQQTNAARMLTFANGILSGIGRGVDFLSIPVPADRNAPDYFAPLAALRRFAAMQVFLGLIHPQDDFAQVARRLEAAFAYLPNAGVSAYCGPSRDMPEAIKDFLSLHRSAADFSPGQTQSERRHAGS